MTPRHIPKSTEGRCPYKKLYMDVQSIFMFIITERKKVPRCPPTDKELNRMTLPHTGVSFSHKKERNAAITWLALENVMPNNRSESQNTTYCTIPFT